MAKEHEAAHGTRSRRSPASEYPEDRFDGLPSDGPVGSHRVTAQPRVTRHFVIGGLIGAALLTTVGIVGVTIAGSSGKLPLLPTSGTSAESTKVKPVLDPEAKVAVLDGTTTDGDAATGVAAAITSEDWGVIVLAGPAATADVEISAVFYSDQAHEAAALALAERLGGVSTYQRDEYANGEAQLTVLIGDDYAGPSEA
ncbi:LytR C-terminal domain-containing protein [Leucobacter komagatae]|uniref:LytR C-terminal domain-containing protein n=1 Tax=Leucobacter komagatae TaxID=55969 RepID=UPI0005AC5FB4|nr:LytR C-terminal domain-containing protein [Leucobacter komagatae]